MSVAKTENSSSHEFSDSAGCQDQDDPLSSQTQTKRTFTFTSLLMDPSRKDYQMIKSCLLCLLYTIHECLLNLDNNNYYKTNDLFNILCLGLPLSISKFYTTIL